MDKKEKTKYIIFIGFFLALLYAVPITQAIAERLKNTRIQALDIAEDALVTPYRNAKKIHDLALQQTFFIDSLIKEVGSPQDSAGVHAQQVVDEALAGLTEMKKIAFTINRHVRVDSTSGQLRPYDTIVAHWSAALQLLRQGGSTADCQEEAARIKLEVKQVLQKCPTPSIFDFPVMCVKNLRYIFWNDRYLRPFEKELENSSVFASACRPRMQYVRYVLFRDLGEKGVLGHNGWFFTGPIWTFLSSPMCAISAPLSSIPMISP